MDKETTLTLGQEASATTEEEESTSYLGYILAAIFVGLVVISPMAFHLPVDRALWSYASWRLADEQVVQVIVEQSGNEPARVISGPLASRAGAAFCEGDFCQSNRSGYGPETEASVVLAFEDGSTVRANMWPDGRFEVADFGGRFLLDAPDLQRIVEEQGVLTQ